MYKAYNTSERQTNKISDSPARICAIEIHMAADQKTKEYSQIKLNYRHTIETHTPGLQ